MGSYSQPPQMESLVITWRNILGRLAGKATTCVYYPTAGEVKVLQTRRYVYPERWEQDLCKVCVPGRLTHYGQIEVSRHITNASRGSCGMES